jgi:molybdate transport system substrate-binding protein
MFKRSMLLFVLLVMSLGISRAQNSQSLTIFAASSLTNAFEQIAETFKVDHPDTEILFNFASSSDLAAQLAEGAPADIFASANTVQMNVAQDAGRIAGAPRVFAKNRLVLIVPADNPANITTLRDLANEGVKIVIAAPAVPVRTYTDTMLERLAADAAYGEAYRAGVMANVVSEEQNVRQVAAKVALGEADAGIVYVSDITSDIREQVTSIVIPDALNTIATYPIALTNDSANPELAQEFINFVLSDAGQDALVTQNFVSIRASEQTPITHKIDYFQTLIVAILALVMLFYR